MKHLHSDILVFKNLQKEIVVSLQNAHNSRPCIICFKYYYKPTKCFVSSGNIFYLQIIAIMLQNVYN